jgi:ribonuclease Z
VAIEQTFTLYHPDGRHPQSTGEQRVWIKVPRRQRVEQVVEGRREVRLAVADQVWIRATDGLVYEAPPAERERERTHLLMPFRRTAGDVLAEWRALGIRDDASHETRVAGRPVTVIGARPGDRDTPSVWLDPEHGVVRFTAASDCPGARPGGPDVLRAPSAGRRLLVPPPPGSVRGRQAAPADPRPHGRCEHQPLRLAVRPGHPAPGPVTAPGFAFLGTAGAVASAERENTSLVVHAGGIALLVDCGGSAVHRLRRVGIDPLWLTHVVVTHLHVDHAYGVPSLVRQLGLLGRRAPLTVVCRPEHVEALRTLLTVFRLWERSDLFPVALAPIDLGVAAPAFTTGSLVVRTAPNDHGAMPNFAVRIEVGGRVLVYSSDTRPCEAVISLARGAGTLVHEATFAERDRPTGHPTAHSSAADAGRVAATPGAGRLILAHVGAEYHAEVGPLADEARRYFAGPVEIAEELRPYSF